MKRPFILGSVLVLMLAPLAAAYAGGAKCSYDAQACLDHHAKAKASYSWLGIEKEHDAQTGAWIVKAVTPGSPAEKGGFQVGDRVVAVNGIRLAKDMDEAKKKEMKAGLKAGAQARYTVVRANAESELTVTLAAVPEAEYARMVGSHLLENHAHAMATASTEAKDAKTKY